MRLSASDPESAKVSEVLLDGVEVEAVEVDTDEGWALCYAVMEDSGLRPSRPDDVHLATGPGGRPLVCKFVGKVEVRFGDGS